MSFTSIRDHLIATLTGQDGSSGWWLITRFHPVAAKIQGIAQYLFEAGGTSYVQLSTAHYVQIGKIVGAPPVDPGVALRRHDLLAMDTPLRLIERSDGHHWNQIRLTDRGAALATEPDTQAIFEEALLDMRFAKQPWFTPQRVAEYAAFDVRPYPAMGQVLEANGGQLDMDEYDLFVSRIKTDADIAPAAQMVSEFRGFTSAQKTELRDLVRSRFFVIHGPNAGKRYSNWRDTVRHTFSLFSLGQTMYREANELFLTTAASEVVVATPAPAPVPPPAPVAVPPAVGAGPALVAKKKKKLKLILPLATAPQSLLVPPAPPQANTGADAELLVGKLLSASGWTVVYYNQKRGYGFDLWAKKGDAAFVIEVKSSVGAYGGVTLTPTEYQAAEHHSDNFLLIIVEHMSATPAFLVIKNPRHTIAFTATTSDAFSASRASWSAAVVATVLP